MPNATLAKPIEIARPGTFRALNGKDYTFTEAILKAAAKAYNPAVRRAALVVGHPKVDSPAYGGVTELRYEKGKLFAIPEKVEAQFADLVNEGRFLSVSPAFLPPGHAANPDKDSWYLRHVGFLGAHPPAIAGLKAPEFAADEEGLVAFASGMSLGSRMAYMAQRMAGMMRRRREAIIEKDGLEAADKEVPQWDLEMLEEDCRKMADESTEPSPSPAFAGSGDDTPDNTGSEETQDDPARAQSLEAREAELAAKEAAFAEREFKAARADFAAVVDDLVADGKVLPLFKDGIVALAFGDEVVEFGVGEEKTTDRRDFLKTFLAQNKTWTPGEVAKPDSTLEIVGPEFAAPAGFEVTPEQLELHYKAQAYQAEHPGTEYLDAYRAVGGR